MDVTYIIPCFNSERTMPRCAAALLKQVGDFSREIIVVDSSPGMQQPTTPLPEGMRLILPGKRMYPGEARNKGMEYAQGKYIAFVDSDVVLKPDWTARMLAAHGRLTESNGRHIILAGTLQNDSSTRTPWADSLTLIEFYAILPNLFEREINVIPAANLFTSRYTLESLQIHFSQHRMAEDILFCRDALKKGARLFLAGTNTVSHITEKSYLRYTFYLGMATSLLRLGETTPMRRAAFLLVLPFGSIYKLIGVTVGLWQNNPRHLYSLLKHLPYVLLGVLAQHAGMLSYPFLRIRMKNSASAMTKSTSAFTAIGATDP